MKVRRKGKARVNHLTMIDGAVHNERYTTRVVYIDENNNEFVRLPLNKNVFTPLAVTNLGTRLFATEWRRVGARGYTQRG